MNIGTNVIIENPIKLNFQENTATPFGVKWLPEMDKYIGKHTKINKIIFKNDISMYEVCVDGGKYCWDGVWLNSIDKCDNVVNRTRIQSELPVKTFDVSEYYTLDISEVD